MNLLIKNAHIIEEGTRKKVTIEIEHQCIKQITTENIEDLEDTVIIDAKNQLLIPGMVGRSYSWCQ